jgi:hypothetical protein
VTDVVVLAEKEPKDAMTRTYLKIADCWRSAAVGVGIRNNHGPLIATGARKNVKINTFVVHGTRNYHV